MSNGRPIRMEWEPLRSLDALSIPSGTYVNGNIGGPMLHPIVQFKIDNLTDVTLVFSNDGINDKFIIPSNGFFLSDIASNQTSAGQGLYLAKGDSIYVKVLSTAATSNAVYLTVTYADSGM